MGRIAAIDFGLKRIGIAVSDEGKKIAFPSCTIAGGPGAIDEIKKTFASKQIELIIIGLPRLLNGTEGPMAEAVRRFAKELETKLNIPVKFVDEWFSSKIADRSLREIQLNRKERSKIIDVTTATMLLQNYLDYL
jgi:putative Holliday junction resolvase